MEVPSPDIRKVLRAYTEAESAALWIRLKRFTYKYYWWLPSRVRGADLDEIIQDAIGDALLGKRKWPPEVQLITFLCQVIRSNVNHLLDRESRTISIEEVSASRLTTPLSGSPAEQQEHAYRQAAYQKLCNKVLDLVQDDPLLSRMVKTWLDNPELKPRDMAHEMGIPIEEIRNAQKRLIRRTSNLRKEWDNV